HGLGVATVVRARRDRHLPRAVVRDAGLADGVTRVAGRGRNEDATRGRVEERDVVRVEVRGRARRADRVVDDVDTVGDGVVDRLHETGGGSAGTGQAGGLPQRLVNGDACGGRDTRGVAQGESADRHGN